MIILNHRLIVRGYKKVLVLTDLWSVRPNDASQFTHHKFDWAWEAESRRVNKSVNFIHILSICNNVLWYSFLSSPYYCGFDEVSSRTSVTMNK